MKLFRLFRLERIVLVFRVWTQSVDVQHLIYWQGQCVCDALFVLCCHMNRKVYPKAGGGGFSYQHWLCWHEGGTWSGLGWRVCFISNKIIIDVDFCNSIFLSKNNLDNLQAIKYLGDNGHPIGMSGRKEPFHVLIIHVLILDLNIY